MMKEQFSRQSFLGAATEEKLARLRIGVCGLGGGGSHIVQQLAHVGVGHHLISDPDIAKDVNLNRLIGATVEDVREKRAKTGIAERLVRGLLPEAQIVAIRDMWQAKADLLRSCHIIFGCLDGYGERAQLEAFCRRFLIPLIDIGMDVHEVGDGYVISGQVILSMPGEHCMRCYGFITDAKLEEEARLYGAAGGNPQVVWPNGVLASTAVGLAVNLICPWNRSIGSTYLEYDGNRHVVTPSNRLLAIEGRPCRHYCQGDVGDPFFELAGDAAA
jgi:molybdopterin-synthase adenylyltransferase